MKKAWGGNPLPIQYSAISLCPHWRLGEFYTGSGEQLSFGLFAVAFILSFPAEDRLFINFIVALTPREYETRMESTVTETTQMLRRYFAGILLQITCITIIVFTGLSIFGIKNALLIGFLLLSSM